MSLPVAPTKIQVGDFLNVKTYKGDVPCITRKVNGVKRVIHEGPIDVKVLKIQQFNGGYNKGKLRGTGNLLTVKIVSASGEIRSLYVEDMNWRYLGVFRTIMYKLKEQWAGKPRTPNHSNED